jgi:hypothetical protein
MNQFLNSLAQVVINSDEINVPQGNLTDNSVQNMIRLVFGIAGGIALIVVTISGFKYVMSQGNPQETAKAKNTLLYALIGLAVCVTAFAIVGFFINEVAPQ